MHNTHCNTSVLKVVPGGTHWNPRPPPPGSDTSNAMQQVGRAPASAFCILEKAFPYALNFLPVFVALQMVSYSRGLWQLIIRQLLLASYSQWYFQEVNHAKWYSGGQTLTLFYAISYPFSKHVCADTYSTCISIYANTICMFFIRRTGLCNKYMSHTALKTVLFNVP